MRASLSREPVSRAPLPEWLRDAVVVPGGLWSRFEVVTETGSTNADLAVAAMAGAAEGTVLVAERQLAGRGRLDRQWHAPLHAALTFSVLLRPRVPPARLGWLPLLAGVALVDAVAPVAATLKWPNDLLVRSAAPASGPGTFDIGAPETGATGGHGAGGDGVGGFGKCAGILAEAIGDAVVLGIGLNVDQRIDELPEPPDPRGFPPTSLALASPSDAQFDRGKVLVAVLEALADRYRAFRDAGGDPVASGLAEAYRGNCLTIGRPVNVLLPGGTEVRGLARDVDADGRLVVQTPDGPRALAAGDVRHVRAVTPAVVDTTGSGEAPVATAY